MPFVRSSGKETKWQARDWHLERSVICNVCTECVLDRISGRCIFHGPFSGYKQQTTVAGEDEAANESK